MSTGVPFRTVLFTPADDTDKLHGAFETDADVLFFDLEDGVDPSRRDEARENAARVLDEKCPLDRPVYVRINGPGTERIESDLRVTYHERVNGFVVPRVESPGYLDAVHGIWNEVARPDHPADLIPLIETAVGVRKSHEIARVEAVHRLALGSMDLLRDLGARWTPEGDALTYVRSRLVVDSRAAGIEPPLDTVWPKLEDTDGLRAEARRSATLGFQGKMLLHPAQIEPVREAFVPSEEEVAWARSVVEAFESAQSQGRGSLSVNGEFVDKPVYDRARSILARVDEA